MRDSDRLVVKPRHNSPVQLPPRRIPVTLQKGVKENIAELERRGIIRGGSRGRVQGVRTPPPWDDLRLSNTTGVLRLVTSQLRHSLVVHPLLKEILDPPLIIQKVTDQNRQPCELTNTMVVVSKPSKIRIHLDPQNLLTVQGDSGTQIPDDDSRWNTHELSKAKDFITLDEKDGFYQIGLDEKNRRKTTFWTAFGRSKYLILISFCPLKLFKACVRNVK